ncbi:MAG: SpoIID/LytB domain-containing protein [bacterium]
MKHRIYFTLTALFILLNAGLLLPEEPVLKTVRIGLFQKIKGITLSGTARMHVVDVKTMKEEIFGGGTNYMVFNDAQSITIGKIKFGKEIKINPLDNGLVKINGSRYRGKIIIRVYDDSRIKVINQLFLEDYLNGILALEISPKWPYEALKTQAVISRTYALKNMTRHEKEGFNLCALSHCQVYGGVDGESALIKQAVLETKGMVLQYRGNLAQTVFFSTCGGHTEQVDHIWKWNSVPEYLKGRSCTYCTQSARYRWTEFAPHKHLLAALQMFGIEKPIKSIKVASRYASGRAAYIMIRHGGKTQKIKAHKFRMAAGPNIIRSTNIQSITRSKIGFTFTGKGFGHGVGLCQWGAKGMAEKGKTYEEILKYYYPGTQIKKIY